MKLKRFSFPTRLLAVASIWISMAMLWNSGRLTNGPVLCWFRALTGHTCPFCGSTRAVGALCSGNLDQAWRLNPLGEITFLCFVIYLLKPSVAASLGSQLKRMREALGNFWTTSGIVALFAATWAWNIATRW